MLGVIGQRFAPPCACLRSHPLRQVLFGKRANPSDHGLSIRVRELVVVSVVGAVSYICLGRDLFLSELVVHLCPCQVRVETPDAQG